MALFEIKYDKGRLKKTLDKLKNTTKDWLDDDTANLVGEAAVKGMKDLIAGGISPIRGGDVNGKFPQYLDRKKYPGKLKPATPVNLKLTGEFLASLTFKVVPKKGLNAVIIHFDDSKSDDIEAGHRAGSDKQKTKKRPIIPAKQGEYLAARIESVLVKILKDRLTELTK